MIARYVHCFVDASDPTQEERSTEAEKGGSQIGHPASMPARARERNQRRSGSLDRGSRVLLGAVVALTVLWSK
jgi:hypothetical protein